MPNLLPLTLCIIFIALGLWHFYWAMGGSFGKNAAIPEINGRPAFTPKAFATALIGTALLFDAVLVAACSRLFESHVPGDILVFFSYALSSVLFLRAVGDFRLVGFSKRVRGSTFARFDTLLYSPLCLALSVGVFLVGRGYGF
jgi:hypothetical protein